MDLIRNIVLAVAALGLTFATAAAARASESSIPSNNYPAKALREDRQGEVGFRLIVDETGRPESCEVTKSSGYEDLDQATCVEVMRRARFKPATDKAGKPIKGTFSSTFRWVIKPSD